jgi:hypothetical protein
LPIALSLMGVFLFIATAMSTHLHPDRAAAHAISR